MAFFMVCPEIEVRTNDFGTTLASPNNPSFVATRELAEAIALSNTTPRQPWIVYRVSESSRATVDAPRLIQIEPKADPVDPITPGIEPEKI